jgi:hypothetical protein
MQLALIALIPLISLVALERTGEGDCSSENDISLHGLDSL